MIYYELDPHVMTQLGGFFFNMGLAEPKSCNSKVPKMSHVSALQNCRYIPACYFVEHQKIALIKDNNYYF